MYGVEILVKEHQNILRASSLMRQISLNVMLGDEVPVDDYRKLIDFIRTYSDKHHHQKEEKLKRL